MSAHTLEFCHNSYFQWIPALIAAFWSILFLQSGIDKIVDYKGNLTWLNGHFSNTFFKKQVGFLLSALMVMELFVGLIALIALVKICMGSAGELFFIANLSAAITLVCLFAAQRIAKDYEGAKTIVIYFIVALAGLITG